MTTMDKIILNTLINNKTVFPDRYIHKTLELYQSKGLSDEDLQYFCSLLIKDSLISEIEYQEIKDYLLQKSDNLLKNAYFKNSKIGLAESLGFHNKKAPQKVLSQKWCR